MSKKNKKKKKKIAHTHQMEDGRARASTYKEIASDVKAERSAPVQTNKGKNIQF